MEQLCRYNVGHDTFAVNTNILTEPSLIIKRKIICGVRIDGYKATFSFTLIRDELHITYTVVCI
jgi:hypothetical protein